MQVAPFIREVGLRLGCLLHRWHNRCLSNMAAFRERHSARDGMGHAIDRGSTTLSVWTRSRGAYVYPLPGGVTPTPTPTSTPTATPTPTATATATSTPTSTPRPTPTRGLRRHRGRILRRHRGHNAGASDEWL